MHVASRYFLGLDCLRLACAAYAQADPLSSRNKGREEARVITFVEAVTAQ